MVNVRVNWHRPSCFHTWRDWAWCRWGFAYLADNEPTAAVGFRLLGVAFIVNIESIRESV